MRPVAGVVRSVALGAIVLLAAGRASAVPESYQFTSGSAVLTAYHAVGDPLLPTLIQISPIPLAIDLDGIQVTVDEATLQLISIDLSSAGPWILGVDPVPMGGFDQVMIENATLTGGDGPISLIDPGPPRMYDYESTPIVVVSDLTASGSVPTISQPGFVMNSPSATGTLFLTGSGVGAMLTIDGLTIADFISPFSGQRAIVKADFVFEGVNPVPEPGSAALLFVALGALGVAARTRSRRY
jgi:hypothetical protein